MVVVPFPHRHIYYTTRRGQFHRFRIFFYLLCLWFGHQEAGEGVEVLTGVHLVEGGTGIENPEAAGRIVALLSAIVKLNVETVNLHVF